MAGRSDGSEHPIRQLVFNDNYWRGQQRAEGVRKERWPRGQLWVGEGVHQIKEFHKSCLCTPLDGVRRTKEFHRGWPRASTTVCTPCIEKGRPPQLIMKLSTMWEEYRAALSPVFHLPRFRDSSNMTALFKRTNQMFWLWKKLNAEDRNYPTFRFISLILSGPEFESETRSAPAVKILGICCKKNYYFNNKY